MRQISITRFLSTAVRVWLYVVILNQVFCTGAVAVEELTSKTSKPAFLEAAKAPEYGFGGSFGFFKPTGDLSSFNNVYGGAGLTCEAKFFQRFKNGIGWEARVGYFKKSGDLVTGPPTGGKLMSTGIGVDYRMVPVIFSIQLEFARLGWMDPVYLGSFFGGLGTLSPFVEAGAGVYMISEKSEKHPELDTDSESKAGYHAGAGFIFRKMNPYKLFFRVDWSSIPGLAGDSGATKAYDETDLGGFSILAGLDVDLATMFKHNSTKKD
jgi:hypothetical protein